MSTTLVRTMGEITAIKPGWRIRVTSRALKPKVQEGAVTQHYDNHLLYVLDTDDTDVRTLAYSQITSGNYHVEILDTGGDLDVEEVDGPHRGLTPEDRFGPEFATLSHDDPVQSGPVNTVVAHPAGGYDTPEPRLLLTVYLPVNAVTVVGIIEALSEEFPNAKVADSGDEQIMWIVEE